jgi:putative hemolysin
MRKPAPRIPLAPILPPALRPWAASLEPALLRLLIPGEVAEGFAEARRNGAGSRFAQRLLELLDIRFSLDDADQRRIPTTNSTVLVANHPYGIVEGLVLSVLLDGVRTDWKILANSLLSGIAEMREKLILVNPFESAEANRENRLPMREAISWLKSGSLLAMFPAGEVAHLDWKEHAVTDPPWKPTAARLALRMRSAVVPVFFEGANSVQFQVAGTLHPGLRTIGLAHEFNRLRGRTLRLRVGNPIPYNVLKGYDDPARATAYLRSRAYFLANRSEGTTPQSSLHDVSCLRTVNPPASERLLSEELAALPADCELAANTDFSVYLAESHRIPRMLDEIGRGREIAFRRVGEGTGRDSDLDRFDRYYHHLFLWSKADRRLAGAYRLAVTSDVLPRFGAAGLYTSTLFRFKPQFFQRLGPAVELGRSFIMPEYQRNYAALLLLWKGITRVVRRRPEAPVLFGAVSISREYRAASRGLIVTYLCDRASHELAQMVIPRRRYRDRALRDPRIKRFAAVAADIEDLSLSIEDIEDDGKGVPVLIRQYLKAGGRLLGFNVDPNFSDVLDALILADLRTAPLALLERCMGREEAREFLAQWGSALPSSRAMPRPMAS